MLILNDLDQELIGKKYLIEYNDKCPFTHKSYTEETTAEIINETKVLMFSYDDTYGQVSYSYFDEVKIIKELTNE